MDETMLIEEVTYLCLGLCDILDRKNQEALPFLTSHFAEKIEIQRE